MRSNKLLFKPENLRDYKFAIASNLKGDSLKKIKKIQNNLKKKLNIKFYSQKSHYPHIRISNSFEVRNKKNFEDLIKELKKMSQKKFKLDFRNPAVFLENEIYVVLRWVQNKEIFILQNKIEKIIGRKIKNYKKELNFIAKATIAFKDVKKSNLVKIIDLLKKSKLPNYTLIDNLCLYAFKLGVEEKKVIEISF